jgi:chemotaxis protein MotB
MDPNAKSKKTIIVVKKAAHHAAHHGGAWKVAYADFVTAMMAFFLVMWLVTQTDGVRQSIAGYFRDPINFSEHANSSGILDGSNNIVLPIESERPDASITKNADEPTPEQAAQEIREALKSMAGELSSGQIEVQVNERGLLIQLMDARNAVFFDLGSATLSPTGEEAITLIARSISRLGLDVVVEGHTDGLPYQNREGYSNWELSTDRANSTRRLLERCGVDPNRIKSVQGFAATRLRIPGHPEDPRNRRIAILVYRKFSPLDASPVPLETLTDAPAAAPIAVEPRS